VELKAAAPEGITPIDPAKHAGMGVPPQTDYAFARSQLQVNLGLHEVRALIPVLPMLLCQGEQRWHIRGVMGLVGFSNLLVGPQGGWLARYIPDLLRMRHLRPIQVSGHDAFGLAVVDALATMQHLQGAQQGQLVTSEGEFTETYHALLKRLLLHTRQVEKIADIADALLQHGLLDEVNAESMLVAPRSNEKVFSVDMTRIADLSPESLAELVACGAMDIGFAMYHSRANVRRFTQLVRQRAGRREVDQDVVEALSTDDGFAFNFDQ
jgi:hypothetical protein